MSSPAVAELPEPARRWLAVGSSTLSDSRAAALEAAAAALTQPDAHLLIVFYSDSHDLPALAAAINEVAGGVPVVGCSSAGELSPDGAASDSIVITALGGPGFSVSTTLARRAGSQPRAAGATVAEAVAAVQHRPHTALMLLTDGLITSQDEILRGVYGVVGAAVPLVGWLCRRSTADPDHAVVQHRGHPRRRDRDCHRLGRTDWRRHRARLAQGRRRDGGHQC